MRIFLAGATGAIGRRLVPLLLRDGLTVFGTTRSEEKAEVLRHQGIEPVVIDMFDAAAVEGALALARPDIVIHQLTDLPQEMTPAAMEAARPRNARLREVATPILLRAARAAGATRAIVQSIAFAYAEGPLPHAETDPITVPSVRALEEVTLTTAGLDGIVLRYGRLWGPGTWAERPDGLATPLHVDAAAHAAWLALRRGSPGTYNIAADDGSVTLTKAREELGFSPDFRLNDNDRSRH
jgi:nucleoside-diphosphate-sugar epimerase